MAANPNVSMTLNDPQKSALLGIPPTTAAPRKPYNPYYEAIECERTGRLSEAERIYLELLNGDFDNTALLASLGMNYAVAEKNGLAYALLQRAYDGLDRLLGDLSKLGITPKRELGFDPAQFMQTKRSELLNAMGTCHKHENRIAIARDYFERAQALIPLNADIQNNLATLYINEGRPADAKVHLMDALKVMPDHPQAHWNLSLAHLELGDYVNGWPEYDYGLTASVRQTRNYTPPNEPPLPFWKGEKGARIVVYGEQGIGDEILFASMLPDLLRDADSVVFECHRKLHKLFANSFPGIDIYPTREDNIVTWPVKPDGTPRYDFTHKLALGSLGRLYRNSLADFPATPYLNPTPQSETKYREKLAALGDGPKIGLSWMGGHKKTRVEVRSIELERLLPIIKEGADKGAHFISLQYTDNEDEIAEFEAKHGIKIHQFPDAAKSSVYDDCAGLVANLDLVITVCTSVVHLAGAMGVPTWVMTPSRPAWRYRLDLDYLPWYGHTTLFRQAEGSIEWQPVIDEVASSLRELMGATQPAKETTNG